MIATILSIGDELLVGQVVNTNATWLSERLTAIGWNVRRVIAVGDDPDAMRAEIEDAARNSNVVITSGGLGPTHDDRTREVICSLLDCELVLDQEQLERIRARFAERGIELNDRSIRQAMVPAACRRLPNEYGSAPGLAFMMGSCRVYVLPGVPTEMRGIAGDHILPELRELGGEIEQRTFLLFGVTESALADVLAPAEALLDAHVTLAYLPSVGGVRLRAMRLNGGDGAVRRYEALLALIGERAASWIVVDDDIPLAGALGDVLRSRGLTLATAESCTGGMIGSLLTEIAGSSDYYVGGIVSYANRAKESLLGVEGADLSEHGAVSRQVAEAMAAGARRALAADIAIAVTGIAGPGGGTAGKPVGTVWIAVASSRGVRAERFQFGRERGIVRQRAAYTAMEMARREAMALPVAAP